MKNHTNCSLNVVLDCESEFNHKNLLIFRFVIVAVFGSGACATAA